MHPDIQQVVVSAEALQARITELAAQISRDYAGKKVIALCVMKGSIFFTTDLLRQLDLQVKLDFITLSSYHGGTVSSGAVKLLKDLDSDLADQHVLVLEDIVDSGRTLHYLVDHLQKRQPASLSVCTLLDKPERREYDVPVDYVGFVIPDVFVVGYGLDYDEWYRALPFVGELKPEVYSEPSPQQLVSSQESSR